MAGLHLLVDAKADRGLTEPLVMEAWVRQAVHLAGLELLGLQLHVFPDAWGSGPGVSVNALIATSHICIHTWPETGYVSMDVYSCDSFNVRSVLDSFVDCFGALDMHHQVIERKCPA